MSIKIHSKLARATGMMSSPATDQRGKPSAPRRAPPGTGSLWLPGDRRARAGLVVALVALLLCCGGVVWVHTGRSLFGLKAGQGLLSFLPQWVPSGIAFEVADRSVSDDELNGEIDTLRALYGVQPPPDEAQLADFRRDAAKTYALSLVVDRAAAEEGIIISDKQARDTLSRFVEQKLGQGPEAHSKFANALGEQGINEQAVLDELKRRLTLSQLFTKITGPPTAPSDAEVRAAFTQRQTQLGAPERRQISNIVLPTKQDADKAIAKIRAGQPFAAVAQQSSMDGSTREKGGDMGQLARDQLEPGYGAAAFSVAPGQTFGPVQNSYGWNIGTIGEITPSAPAQYDQVKEQLHQRLQMEHALDTWRGWLSGQIQQAGVRYAPDYQPTDADAVPGESPEQAGIPNAPAQPSTAGGGRP